ncbi:alpha/beta fold hydrolase [Nocardia brasiliensis]|uniref:alpha/beta fold hydrolase n=1 Tax=Nocardia brasiliensis TaxID=37326 RepID=UPI0033C492EE
MTQVRKAVLAAVSAAGAIALAAAPVEAEPTSPTIVLVHGAFADATSWDSVAAKLRADGYRVVVPDNPLRGPGSDAAVIEQTLAGIDGPVVLVEHSYGGAVITNVTDPDVRALVYIAAFAPAPGEPMFFAINPLQFPGSRLLPPALSLTVANGGVDGYVDPAHFREVFAHDVSDVTAANMIAHQKSIAAVANIELSGPASWSTTPSWFLVSADDRVIPPPAQRFMAQRAGSHTTEVSASHASLVSQPAAVAAVIEQAAQ